MLAISATGNRGFTLMELLVVLTVILLIAGAWPLASSHVFVTQRLRNEMQELASTIRIAQVTARTTGKSQRLLLSADGASYGVGDITHELPDGVTVHLDGEAAPSSANPLVLYPDGSSTGATLDLSSRDRVMTLRVLPMLGRLEMSQ